MRFPYTFQRRKAGSGSVALLGSDSAPTGQPKESADNQGAFKRSNINGYPIERLAVALDGPSDLSADVYIFEDATAKWYKVNAGGAVTLKAGCVTNFAVPCLAEPGQTSRDLFASGGAAQPGALDVAIVIADPGAAANGTYTVAFGPNLSSA